MRVYENVNDDQAYVAVRHERERERTFRTVRTLLDEDCWVLYEDWRIVAALPEKDLSWAKLNRACLTDRRILW